MGQKSNLITLRKFKKNLNLLSYETKNFVQVLKFLRFFEYLLMNKGVWVINKTINYVSNKLYLNLSLFYRSAKTTKYKKKGYIKNQVNKRLTQLKNKSLLNLFDKHFTFFNQNLFILSINNLNTSVNSKVISFFYHKTKKFVNIIFARRFNLYIDFLKITSLLCQNKLNSEQYIYLLAQIFKSLPKRAHTRFLFFIKLLFKIIINEFPLLGLDYSFIKGIKFVIHGKLQGKPRATFNCIQEGCIPIQSFGQNVDFAKIHSYTLLGAFGLKIWIYRK
jgi:hypothetical protein